MDAASRTGVDDVREIIEATRFRPMQARTKVFIVDEVHMLSRNAFNALLKTLEEPPPHVKVRVRHDRDTQGAGDRAVALPALRPAPNPGDPARVAHYARRSPPPSRSAIEDPRPWPPSRAPPTARCATGCRCWTRRSRWARARRARPASSPASLGRRHAGHCRPRRGVRPDGGGHGTAARRTRWPSPTAPTRWAPISARLPGRSARADPHPVTPENQCPTLRTQPGAAGGGAHPRRSPRRCPDSIPVLGPRLADAAEAAPPRLSPHADRRAAGGDGADPPVPRGRAAAARRAGPPAAVGRTVPARPPAPSAARQWRWRLPCPCRGTRRGGGRAGPGRTGCGGGTPPDLVP